MKPTNSGVSEVVTAILLISLVVSGMAVVGVFVSTLPAQTKKVPQVSIQVCNCDEGISMYHDGGDVLERDEYMVNILSGDKSIIKTVKDEDLPSEWSTGNNFKITDPPSDAAFVQIVSKEGGGDRLFAWSSIGRECAPTIPTTIPTTSPPPTCSLTPGISADPGTSGNTPFTVTFEDASISTLGIINSTEWDFGDGETSSEENPTHMYSDAGTYTVTLTVKNTCGKSGTASEIIHVYSCESEVKAKFTTDPNPPTKVGGTTFEVQFTDASTCSGGTINSWIWDFGEGTIRNTPGPHSIIYDSYGQYTVYLTVQDSCGREDTNSIIVSFSESSSCSITPGISADPGFSGNAPFTVTFTDVSTSIGGQIDTWSWNFGEGTTNLTKGPHEITYLDPGTYTISLSVHNDCGKEGSITKGVNVNSCVSPIAAFSANPTTGYAPLLVSFTDESTGATSWQWDFTGNGIVDSTDKNPQYTYSSSGTYDVTLTVSGPCGSASVIHQISVGTCTAPEPAISAEPTTGYAPLGVSFADASTGTITAWAWDFNGDGTVDSTEQNPGVYTYDIAGTYNAALTVTGPCGTGTATQQIVVSPCTMPVAVFTADPTSGVTPLTVSFTEASTGTITTWEWDFNGDGTTDATGSGTKSYTYNTAGTYNAKLTVTGQCGTNTATQQVLVTCTSPTAAFIASPASGIAPLTVTFTDTSTGTITDWSWDFNGDGTTDATGSGSKSYTYTTAGTYNAALIVTGPCGTDTIYQQVVVTTCTAPVAFFTADPMTGYAPLTVTFTETSTGTITDWSWDFNGDGTTDATGQGSKSYTYTAPGTYNAKLTVTGPCGTNSLMQQIVVNACTAPVAVFTASPTTGYAPLIVTFTETSTGTITDWSWDFNGDGTIDATGQGSKSYTYTAPGTYNAKLTVTGPCGTNSLMQQIVVNACTAPVAVFTASPASGIAPLTVTFTDTSTGTITDWSWDFNGDGTTDATGSGSKSYTYTTAGTYNAALTVTGPCGTDTVYQQVVVTTCTPPVAFFTADPMTGYAPLDVTFTDSSMGTITVWEWDFEDDGTIDSTEQNPLHTYSSPGTYDVNLTVKGPCGESSAVNQVIVTDCNPGIRGDYYPTRFFTGTPVSRVDSRLRFADAAAVSQGEVTDETNWPQATLGKQDQFSVDYQGTLLVPTTGTYTFTLRSDDGSYLWIDDTDTSDTPVIDNWGDHAPQNRSASISLTQGTHPIRVRMYENSGRAVLALFWSGPGFSTKYVDSFCLGCTPPTAAFTASPTTGYAPLAVTFTDSSTGSISSYEWDFGDGQTATGIGPHTHTYTTAGTFTAELTVTGSCGTSTSTQQIVVSACIPPAASFTASPTSGYAPLTVTFTDTSTGTISTWWWDFNGDGTVDATGSGTKSYTYTTAGTFNANLTVAGPCGTSTVTQQIVVSTCTPPTASFTASPTSGMAPLAVTFTDASTGTITSWQWDFNNDGTVDATGIGPHTHTYTTAGTYTAKLTVTGPCGTSMKTQQIVVSPCQHTITASAGTGGYISPSGSVVVPCGQSQTFTIIPNRFYVINDVIVDGQSQGQISSYTFTDVQADHTIQATFLLRSQTCSVSGYVYLDSTYIGVSGIRVEMWNEDQTILLHSSITQSNGDYVIYYARPPSSINVDIYCPDQGTWYTTYPFSPRGWYDDVHLNPGGFCSVGYQNFWGHYN